MNLFKKLSLPSENATRKKPSNQNNNDKYLFNRELNKILPAVAPDINKNSYIFTCGKLFNGLFLNLNQFNMKISFKNLLKSYLKSFFVMFKTRKITRLNNILYVTNSNSKNFFHWFLDVLPKLEFINKNCEEIFKFKIIIPNDNNNYFSKKSLEAFDLDFYYQKKNEIIIASQSILLPNIAPTGNYRKDFVSKLSYRMRNHWISKRINKHNKKRIYISRKNSKKRKIINEDEIIPILKNNNFIILDFDTLNFKEQLDYILDCEVLVSMHGAGLTHMLWMKDKSKVLEIRTRNNCNDNCYFSLASDLGHDYFYVTADKVDKKQSFHNSDVEINTKDFLLELNKTLLFK